MFVGIDNKSPSYKYSFMTVFIIYLMFMRNASNNFYTLHCINNAKHKKFICIILNNLRILKYLARNKEA